MQLTLCYVGKYFKVIVRVGREAFVAFESVFVQDSQGSPTLESII